MVVSKKEREGNDTFTRAWILYSLWVIISTLKEGLSFHNIQMPPEKLVRSTCRECECKEEC